MKLLFKVLFIVAILIFTTLISMLLSALYSIVLLCVIDFICGTDFFSWVNVGILAVILTIVKKIKSNRDGSYAKLREAIKKSIEEC